MANDEQQSIVTTKPNVTLYNNTEQEHIIITSDKAKLILLEYLGKVKNKTVWITPASLLITLFLIPITSEFKNALGISADAWSGFCYIAIFILFIWLLYATWLWLKEHTVTIDTIIEKLKNKP